MLRRPSARDGTGGGHGVPGRPPPRPRLSYRSSLFSSRSLSNGASQSTRGIGRLGAGTQMKPNQRRHRAVMHRTPSISTSTYAYPYFQCSSGMSAKFIPYKDLRGRGGPIASDR